MHGETIEVIWYTVRLAVTLYGYYVTWTRILNAHTQLLLTSFSLSLLGYFSTYVGPNTALIWTQYNVF